MRLNQNELKALKNLLSNPKNRIDESLDNLYNKMISNSEISLYIGGVIIKNGEEVFSFSEYLHDATNNEAEYTALVKGLKYLIQLKLLNANIYSDSELVVKQINGEYRVKHPRMQKLYKEAMDQFQYMDTWTFNHILRDKNDSADRLAKSGRLKGKK